MPPSLASLWCLATASGPVVIAPLDHHALLIFLVQVTLLLFVARALGEVMRKINLPPVVGELTAGVLLGPSIFGAIAPDLAGAVFPAEQAQSDLLAVVSWIGVLLLLVVTGLETDIQLVLRKGVSALLVSLGGLIVPFGTGLALGWYLPAHYLVDTDQRLVFALFMAVAMSLSAVPVIAKVLIDMKLIRRDVGQVTLAAGMTDDTIGWILLSVVAGLASSGVLSFGAVLSSLSGAILFLVIGFTLGRRIVDWLLHWVDEHVGGADAQLTVVLVLSFGAAALTQYMGIEAALGAFVVGMLAGQARRWKSEVGHTIESITTAFVAPIFFGAAGLKVDVSLLLTPEKLGVTLLVLVIACLGKFVGVYLGAWAGGLSHWERIAMGSGMNARGAIGVIVATVGLGLGVLTLDMYSIVVLVSIITSLMAPPMLRWSLGKVTMGPEEQARLEREQMEANSFARTVRRVLLPTRGGRNVELAAHLIGFMHNQQSIEATILFSRPPTGKQQAPKLVSGRLPKSETSEAVDGVREQLREVRGLETTVKIVEARSPAEAILSEAGRGYQLIAMGASQNERAGALLFNNVVDQVLQSAPCACLVVQSARDGVVVADPPKTILVPTVGTEYSKNALELASVLAAGAGAVVVIVHVVYEAHEEAAAISRSMRSKVDIGRQIVDHEAAVAQKLGAQTETVVLQGGAPEEMILELAKERRADLIVLGTEIRPVSGRAFLGHRVDRILEGGVCPVAIVSSS